MKTGYLSKSVPFLVIALGLAGNAFATANPAFCGSTDGATCLNPVSISLSANPGQQDLVYSVPIYILTNNPSGVSYTASRSAGATWMSISCAGSTAPSNPDVCGIHANASSITTASTLTGSFTLTSGSLTVTINVKFIVGGGGSGGNPGGNTPTLQASPASISLTYPTGNSAASITVSAASGSTTSSFYATLTTQSGGQWLSLACPNNTSCTSQAQAVGSVLNLSVNTSVAQTLSIATYQATVTLSNSSNSNDVTTVSVSLSINGASGGGNTLQASPASISLTYPTGTSAASITVSAASGSSTTGFYAALTTQSGGQWLTLACPNNTSCTTQAQTVGSVLNLSVNTSVAQTLSAAVYQATVTLTNASNSNDVTTVSVSLSINGASGGGPTATLQATPASISLSYPTGTSAASISVNAAGGSSTTSFYATLAIQSGGQWLILTCPNNTSCTTQAQAVGGVLNVSVNTSVAQTLATAVYQATLTLTNAANSSDVTTVSVSLSINGASGGGSGLPAGGTCQGATTATIAAPSSLSFVYSAGAGVPAPQYIFANGSNLSVTYASATGANFISATVGGSVAAHVVPVTVQEGLPPGSYSGSVAVTSSLGCQVVPVSLTVYSAPSLMPSPGMITCESNSGICTDQGLTINSSDGSTMSLAISSSAPWVTFSPPGCGNFTPASCTVSIHSSTLVNCLNTAAITVFSTTTTANPVLTVPVVARMDNNCTAVGTGVLTTSSDTLSFTTPNLQTLYVSAPSAINFSATSKTSNCGTGWLAIAPAGAVSYSGVPVPIQVNIVPSNLSGGLAAGTQCTGEVDLTANETVQIIPVTYTLPSATGGLGITGGSSAGGPAVTSLSFTVPAGGANPASQSLYVTGPAGAAGTSFNYATSASWMAVNGSQSGHATTPAALSVTVNPTGLAAGPYNGSITLGPSTISVSLTVTPPTVTASPLTLNFTYALSGSLPQPQTINVSGNGAALAFTATAGSTGNWLMVSPTFATTPASGTLPLTVSLANLDGLSANKTYQGVIVVAGTGGASGATTVNVNLAVNLPQPTIVQVTNAASGIAGPIAAGEVISIFGSGLGPVSGAPLTPGVVLNQSVPTTAGLGGVQVTIGGYPAPLIYTSSTQVQAIVPYEINSPAYLQSPAIVLQYLGQTSNSFPETQTSAAPGIFTAGGAGSGPGAILNSDNSTNCHCASGRPANQGETVALFVTGEGQTIPAGKSGVITSTTPPYPMPVLAPAVTVNGESAQVLFYAEAPGMVAGILQINIQIPPDAPSGDLPVVVSFGNARSQIAGGIGAATVAVK